MNLTKVLVAAAMAVILAAGFSCESNRRPSVPVVPTGPDSCLKDSTYTFTTVAIDPDGDSVALRFDWGDSTPSHWVGWFASGETVALTHVWSDTGNYEVRVSAQDRQLSSNLSDGLMVRVTIRWPPDTPDAPLGPDLGGQDSSYDFTAGANHPDGIPVAVRFAWGDGDTSDWSDFVSPGDPVSASHIWSAPGSYFVTAQAEDTDGLTSPWSSPQSIVVRPPYWSRLMMVGSPAVTPDGSGFLINVVNVGTAEDTVNSLAFSDASESLYMRDFRIGQDHCGYPIPNGMPGTGPGDTVHFTAPVTIAPDMSQMVELYSADFHVDPLGADTSIKVPGRTFQLRISDGSEISVRP